MQPGLWRSVQAFSKASPAEAVRVAMGWLDEAPDSQLLATIAYITGSVRTALVDTDAAAAQCLALENRLRSSDNAAWRAAYIQSWAPAVEHGLLTQEKARELFDQYVTKGSDEETAWCSLLYLIARRQSVSSSDWSWIHSGVKCVARAGLGSTAQHWLVLTVLKGLAQSREQELTVQSPDWLDRFQSLCPVSSSNAETWNLIIGVLVDLTRTEPAIMRSLVVALATHSGHEWLERKDDNQFRYFLDELREHNQHEWVASHLCVQPGTYCRRLGLLIFAACEAPALNAATVSEVTANRVELLLREAQRYHIDYAALARLHAALAHRIDELAGHFPDLLYEEVAWQCRNTYAYRRALRSAARDNEYLVTIAANSEERMKETREALDSPALQMEVPGYARAQRLQGRRMARQTGEGCGGAVSLPEHDPQDPSLVWWGTVAFIPSGPNSVDSIDV